jgi:Tol biopolymer transport system component
MNKVPLALLLVLPATVSLFPVRAEEPTKLVKPVPLPVNTEADEDDPHLSSNGLKLFYSSNADGKYDILVSQRRTTAQSWPKGKKNEELDFLRTKVDDRSVFVTPEGKLPQYIYYATKKDKEKGNSFDIYVAVKNLPGPDKVFSEPTALTTISTREADELHPWLTADGKSLYFSRKTKEGWRVFVATREKAGIATGFTEPAMLEDLPVDFHHATLTPDGKTMILQGPVGDKGRWGLYVSTKTDMGWSNPEPLDMLNHPEGPTGDKSPNLSRDGTRLYFASDRPGGKGGMDLYAVETAAILKKK